MHGFLPMWPIGDQCRRSCIAKYEYRRAIGSRMVTRIRSSGFAARKHLQAGDDATVADVLEGLEVGGEPRGVRAGIPCDHGVGAAVEGVLLRDVNRRVARQVPAQLGRRSLLRANYHEGWQAVAAVFAAVWALTNARAADFAPGLVSIDAYCTGVDARPARWTAKARWCIDGTAGATAALTRGRTTPCARADPTADA
eukprot:scaffold7904_cov103-Isochrysis_galbana.AAC.9